MSWLPNSRLPLCTVAHNSFVLVFDPEQRKYLGQCISWLISMNEVAGDADAMRFSRVQIWNSPLVL